MVLVVTLESSEKPITESTSLKGCVSRFDEVVAMPRSAPTPCRHPGCGVVLEWAGYRTIGWGHLCDQNDQPVTEAEAEAYLAADLMTALAATLRYCPVLATEPEGRLAAIVDFTFNLGAGRLQTSTLRRRINQRDWVSACEELRRWGCGGGNVLPGLAARREAEITYLILKH